MKQPKKLTRSQKSIVSANGVNPNGWFYMGDINETYFKIINLDGKVKIIDSTRRKSWL